VYAKCFQAKVILHGPKETGDFPRQEAYGFDTVWRVLMQLKVGPTKGKKTTDVGSTQGVFSFLGG
jgi:hypothetical protein